MIPRRTITFYRGMFRDIVRFMIKRPEEDVITRFEKEFAGYVGTSQAVSTSSGTDAMIMILDGLGLKPGDHLLATAYTIQPLIGVFKAKGYDLELIDIDEDDFNVSVADLEKKIRPRTIAVIVTHIFGSPARMDEIKKVLVDYDCALIEDAAHAHGAVYKGRRCGSLADAAFFSFDQVKPLSTFGGGMVTTDDRELATRIRKALAAEPIPEQRLSKALMGYLEHAFINSPLFRLFCWFTRFERTRQAIGFLYRKLDRRPPKRNLRLSRMQAFLGLRQLEHLDERLAARQRNAALITKSFRGLTPQKVAEGCSSTYYKFTALAPGEARSVKELLYQKGIDAGIEDDINYPCHRDLGQGDELFPVTSDVYRRLLDLPGYETLSEIKLLKIAEALSEIE